MTRGGTATGSRTGIHYGEECARRDRYQPETAYQPELAFGIDIGGTGIKGGVVDLRGGVLIGDGSGWTPRNRPHPQAVATTAGKVAAHFDYQGPFGVAFPAWCSAAW